MTLADASKILRGQKASIALADQRRAASRVLAALDDRHLLVIWVDRLLAALDGGDVAGAARARRRLREVLDRLADADR